MSSNDTATIKVLVVDDQKTFRDAARAVLERLNGFEVLAEARSGEEAIEMTALAQPDLVLMDINMGGIDGVETTRQLTSTYPGLLVVLMSTYELCDLPPGARSSGASAYINKDDLGGRWIRRIWEDRGDPLFGR